MRDKKRYKRGVAIFMASVLGLSFQGPQMAVWAGGGISENAEPVIEEMQTAGDMDTPSEQTVEEIEEKGRDNLGEGIVPLSSLMVNGESILEASGYTISCGEGTAVFDESRNTLTLNNAEIIHDPTDPSITSGISGTFESTGGLLNIELEGENRITGFERGIFTGANVKPGGDLKLSGRGNLEITASKDGILPMAHGCTIENTAISLTAFGNESNSNGISVDKFSCTGSELVISGWDIGISVPSNGVNIQQGSSVEITSKSIGINGGDKKRTSKFLMEGSDLDIETELGPAISGSGIAIQDCHGELSSQDSNAVYSESSLMILNSDLEKVEGYYPALMGEGDLTFTGGRLNCQSTGDIGIYSRADIRIGGNARIKAAGNYAGLGAEGNLTVDSGSLNCSSVESDGVFSGGSIVIDGDSQVEVSGKTTGLYAKSNLTVHSGSLNCKSTEGNGINSQGNILLDGNTRIEAAGKYPGIYTEGSITVNNAQVSAESEADIGIYLKGSLNISGTVYAKGAAGFPAVGAEYVKQDHDAEPPVGITLGSRYEEIHGGRISASDWFMIHTDPPKTISRTSFIPGNDTGNFLADGSNGLNEITIRKKQTTPVYTVIFDTGGGSPVNAMAVVRGGCIYRPDDPVREGFLFTGWYKDRETTQAWNFAGDVVLENTTLYAGWEREPARECMVTFDSRGGSLTEPVSDINEGSLLKKPADPVRKFYEFSGWYKDEQCSQAWDFSRDTVEGDLVLYAGWKPYTPKTPVITKVVSNTSAVKITWQEIPEVTGYVVYGYTGDAFTRGLRNFDSRIIVRGGSNTSCLEKGLKPGTQRTYLVRAYKNLEGKNHYSGPSRQENTAVKPMAAVVKSVTPMKGAAYVALRAKAQGAVGYAYCTSMDGNEYWIVAKGPKEPYRMRGLEKGTNYIKVRSYTKDITGKTVYGNWSKTYKVKVR